MIYVKIALNVDTFYFQTILDWVLTNVGNADMNEPTSTWNYKGSESGDHIIIRFGEKFEKQALEFKLRFG